MCRARLSDLSSGRLASSGPPIHARAVLPMAWLMWPYAWFLSEVAWISRPGNHPSVNGRLGLLLPASPSSWPAVSSRNWRSSVIWFFSLVLERVAARLCLVEPMALPLPSGAYAEVLEPPKRPRPIVHGLERTERKVPSLLSSAMLPHPIRPNSSLTSVNQEIFPIVSK
jgi:hypothetical protein